jgi:hypothetical protein
MTLNRTFVTQLFTVARGETRLALSGAPEFLWRLGGVAGWALLAILMGSILGLAAVALPPMGLAAIIGGVGLVLLWVLPDTFAPPKALIRRLLFVVVVVDLTIPTYYMVEAAGLPWISARRTVTFILVMFFAFAFSTSSESRAVISRVIRTNKLSSIFLLGFMATIVLSIFTSIDPGHSISALVDLILEGMVPFIVTLYVIRTEKDVDILIRTICWCGLFICFMGMVEFVLHHRPYLYLIPKSMLASLIAENQSFMVLVNEMLRNGQYRASSVYIVSLSFAEFEAMIAPIGAVYLFHGRTLKDKLFGAAVAFSSIIGIFISGSRGGYVSALLAAAMLFCLLIIRRRLHEPQSLASPILSVVGATGMCLVLAAILFVGRINHLITGGGEGALSTDARKVQWALAWPKILANPITGHGFANGGSIVGYTPFPGAPPSVDSYLLSLIVETGVPSVFFFFGIAAVTAWTGVRRYIRDASWGGSLSGGLACSVTAFTFYRLFLSQRENQTIYFILIGCIMIMHTLFVQSKERAEETKLNSRN